MKKYSFFLLIFIISCQQTYQYKGDLPQIDYMGFHPDFGIIHTLSIPHRDRIYVSIDSNNQILMNNHLLERKEFKSAFQFALENPKQLKHLPQSWEDAIVMVNYGDLNTTDTLFFKIKQQIDSIVMLTLGQKIFWSKKQKDMPPLKELGEEESLWLLDELMPRIAVHNPYTTQGNNAAVKLPHWMDEPYPYTTQELKKRNVLNVLVNENDSVFVNNQSTKIKNLTTIAKTFIKNPNQETYYAESPGRAIISLKNNRGASYEVYIQVYNALKNAYSELWEAIAQDQFGQPYESLDKAQQRQVRKQIPLVIAEAESDFGE